MIYITSDHAGFELKKSIIAWFTRSKKEFVDLCPDLIVSDDYPDRADELVIQLKENPKAVGVAICGTGQGMCIALNRHEWVRAGLSLKREIVRLSRAHNNANVICLPGRFTSDKKALALVKVFLNTPFSKEQRHINRIKKLSQNKD